MIKRGEKPDVIDPRYKDVVDQAMKFYDTDKLDGISLDEMRPFVRDICQELKIAPISEEEIEEIFVFMDKDGSGFLDEIEIYDIMMPIIMDQI